MSAPSVRGEATPRGGNGSPRRGLVQQDLDRIDAPVGLDIGAIGPAEIALSIAAAMVGAFNSRDDKTA